VNDALRVRIGERVRDLLRDPDRVVDGQLLLPIEPVTQRRPFDERHYVIQQAFGLAESNTPTMLGCCLLEDDALITAIDVKSEQLLGSAGDPSHVRLAIEVDVRVAHPRSYNSIFSGE